MLWTRRAYQNIIFRAFECCYERSPSSSYHLKPHGQSSFTFCITVKRHHALLLSVIIKDNSSPFLSPKPWILSAKRAYQKRNFQTFEWFIENYPNFLCHNWNHKSFFQTSHPASVSWEITFLYFFSWNFIWFVQKETINVQNFKLSTAHVKFHQNLYFDGFLLLKVYKISAKKV